MAILKLFEFEKKGAIIHPDPLFMLQGFSNSLNFLPGL